MAITVRDIAILSWINKHGFVSVLQIQERFNMSRTAFYCRAKEMRAEKLLNTKKILMSAPVIAWCTPAGAELASNMGPAGQPAVQNITHDLAVVDLSMRLLEDMQAQGKKAEWISEREIKAAEMAEIDKNNGKEMFQKLASRTPDGVLVVDGVKMAIELELTLKSRSRLKKIMNEYALDLIAGKYQSVVYYCSKPATFTAVSEEIQELSTSDRFQVLMLENQETEERKCQMN